MESAGIAVTGLTTALSAIPAVAVIAAVTGITAAVISFTLEAQKANIEAEKISETYVRAADDTIAANNGLIKSINEAREASEEAAKETNRQIAKADEVKRKLDNLCDSNGKLKDASLDVNEELKILNDTFGLQLTAINGQIQGWNDLKGSYEDYCKSLRANAELEAKHASYVNAVGNLQSAKDIYQSNWDMYVKAKKAYETYDGNDQIEYQRLADEVTQAKLSYEQSKSNLGLTQKTINEYEQFAKENDPDEITRKKQGQYGGMQEEAAKKAKKDGSEAQEILDSYKSEKAQKNEEELIAEKEVLDKRLKLHKINEEQYYEELEKLLNEHVDKESETWWEYYDKIENYRNKGTKSGTTAVSAASAAATQTPGYDNWLKAEKEKLDKKLKLRKFNNEEEYYEELDKLLNDHVNKESETWWDYYEKVESHRESKEKEYESFVEKSTEKIDKLRKKSLEANAEKFKEWSENSQKAIDEVAKAEEKLQNTLKSTADNMKPGSLYDMTETTKGTRPVFRDLSKDNGEIRQYIEDYKKLEQLDGIPQELLDEIKAMDFSDRKAVVKELLQMRGSSRNDFFSDYNTNAELRRQAAEAENSKLYEQTEEAKKAIQENVFDSMPDIAYAAGNEAAQEYIKGMTDYFGSHGISAPDFYGGSSYGGNVSGGSGDRYISTSTPMVIQIGTEVINTTIRDVLSQSGLIGRGNSRL